MKVALIKPPSTYADWYKRPVLGLAYISAYLNKRGYVCRVFDGYFNSWSKEHLVSEVTAFSPDIVGITAMTHEISTAAEIACLIKKIINIPVVAGGPHITALPRETMEEFPVFDFAVFGEGEQTMAILIGYLSSHQQSADITSISGLAYRMGNDIFVNAPRPFLTSAELNEMPYPSFDDYYKKGNRSLSSLGQYYVMFSSRGCPYHCAFCMQVLGRKIRRRSSENIIGEIMYAMNEYGAREFNFADEIFLMDTAETRNLLQTLLSTGIAKQIKWSGLTRANLVNEDILRLAKSTGCVRLEIGVESGDDDILRKIDKNITVSQIKNAVNMIKKMGIALGTYYILGHPGETLQTLKKTINLAVLLNTTTIAVGIMVPYPGTRIYEMASRRENGYKLLSKVWQEYDKYGGRAMELEGLSYSRLLHWQRKTIFLFYLKNLRLFDLVKYFWTRRRAVIYMIKNIFKDKSRGKKFKRYVHGCFCNF